MTDYTVDIETTTDIDPSERMSALVNDVLKAQTGKDTAIAAHKLNVAIAELEAERDRFRKDTARVNWLNSRDHYIAVGPATNMVGVPKGWTYWKPGQMLDGIGERCYDLRQAVDKAMRAWKD